MAISATIVDIRGKAYEPILEELLFENKTVADNLVSFETDVKNETIITESSSIVALQAYSSGAPSSSGTFGFTDTAVTPTKVMFYQEFDPNTLRPSRFKRSMKPGAWEIMSTEFERTVMAAYAKEVSLDAESKWWTGVTSATKTAIAALSPGTANNQVGAAEQTWSAAQTATQFDGVVAKMIYNAGALGLRVKVAGTTISSTNVATEYAKVYAAIPAVVLAQTEKPFLYAPYSHKQFINIYNVSATYRDLFAVDIKADKYFYNGIEIKFVPVPENCVIAALPSNLIWCTDLVADINKMEINKIANNREDMFVKHIFTIAAHVARQANNVLYLG
tara:strand:+ start:233 stop:1231 length:999 start_codon:yes stop_codon:yes gene_type:complete